MKTLFRFPASPPSLRLWRACPRLCVCASLLLLSPFARAVQIGDHMESRSVYCGATVSTAGIRLTITGSRQVTSAGTINGTYYAATYEAVCGVAGTNSLDCGTSLSGCVASQYIAVKMPQVGAIRTYVADGAISVGATVYRQINGQVTATNTGSTPIGIAITPAMNPGDELEVLRNALPTSYWDSPNETIRRYAVFIRLNCPICPCA